MVTKYRTRSAVCRPGFLLYQKKQPKAFALGCVRVSILRSDRIVRKCCAYRMPLKGERHYALHFFSVAFRMHRAHPDIRISANHRMELSPVWGTSARGTGSSSMMVSGAV